MTNSDDKSLLCPRRAEERSHCTVRAIVLCFPKTVSLHSSHPDRYEILMRDWPNRLLLRKSSFFKLLCVLLFFMLLLYNRTGRQNRDTIRRKSILFGTGFLRAAQFTDPRVPDHADDLRPAGSTISRQTTRPAAYPRYIRTPAA